MKKTRLFLYMTMIMLEINLLPYTAYAGPSCTLTALTTPFTKNFVSNSATNAVDLDIAGGGTIDNDNCCIDILHVYVNGVEVLSGTWAINNNIPNANDRVLSNPNNATIAVVPNTYSPGTGALKIHLPLTGLNVGNNVITYQYESPTTFEGTPRAGPQGIADESWCVDKQDFAVDCNVTPSAAGCPAAIAAAYCADHASDPICIIGTPQWCANGQQADVHCPGSVAYCTAGHSGEDICTSGKFAYCFYHNDMTSCLGTTAAECYHGDCSHPSFFNSSCSASGDSVTLTWGAMDGITTYYPRVDYSENNGSSLSCGDGWNCDSKDYSGSVNSTTLTLPVIPDKQYSAWVHGALPSGDGSGVMRTAFMCPKAPPPDCSATPNDILCQPGNDKFCAMAEHKDQYVCNPAGNEYCNFSYNRDKPVCHPGSPEYCAKVNGTYPACTLGTNCLLSENAGKLECNPSTTAFCATWSNYSCTPGTHEYCTSRLHDSEAICNVGTEDFCGAPVAWNSTTPLLDIAYTCKNFCALNSGDKICPGSDAWCKLDANKTSDKCPGSDAYCNDKISHPNDPKCPGSFSYCQTHRTEDVCKPISSNNNGTPYSVYNTTHSTAIGTVLCNAVYYTKSSVGRSLAILAILILGISALLNKISWGHVLMVCVGIAAVFGASQLAVFIGDHVSGMGAVLKCLTGD